MEQEMYLEKALLWAKRKGLQKIKANVENYETPSAFSRPGDEELIFPYITGMQMGNKNYIEIVIKSDEEEMEKHISKWKLLGTMASMRGGSLYLLAPKGHKAFAEAVVKTHSLNAKVIYLV